MATLSHARVERLHARGARLGCSAGSSSLRRYYSSSNNSDTEGTDVAIDSSGRVFVVGDTEGAGLPTTASAFQPSYAGGSRDGFLVRFSSDGANLDYATYLGGSNQEAGRRWPGVACDDAGRAWFVADSQSTDWPVSANAWQTQNAGGIDGVVACLDTTRSGSSSLLFSTYIGGTGLDAARGIVVDTSGRAWVGGVTSSADFPVLKAWQKCRRGTTDTWLAEFDGSGAVIASTFFGGSGNDGSVSRAPGNRLARDATGAVYLSGRTASTDLATPGAFQTLPASSVTGFVAKFLPSDPPMSVSSVRVGCVAPAPPNSLRARNLPSLGTTFQVEVDDPTNATGLPPGSTVAFWMLSGAKPTSFPCGVLIPAFGANGPGELMLDLPVFFTPPKTWMGPGIPTVFDLPIPCESWLSGGSIWTQAVFSDGSRIVLTDALDFTVGY